MSLKAALRAAHAALASGQLDEALERCQEAISLGESVDAYLWVGGEKEPFRRTNTSNRWWCPHLSPLNLQSSTSTSTNSLTGKALYKKADPESLSQARAAYRKASELVTEAQSPSIAPWKGLAEVAAATADDGLLAEALTRVVDGFVASSSSVSSDKEAISALESVVSLSGTLMRLGKEEEAASAAAPSKLAAVAEKISGDLPGFFNASDESQDEEEAKTKAVFAFHEATVAAWLASGAPKEAELSLDALLALRKKKKKKPKTSLLLSSAAVADALASRLSSSARKEAAAAASSSYDYSRLLEAAAESCLEFAREVGGGEGGEQEEGKKTTAAGALVAAFDLALDAEAASEGEGESSKATALWREAAAALSSPSSSLDAAAATAAASEASAFTRWREAFEGTSSSSSSPQQQPGPLDAATRASLREGLRARWSRVAAATSSSSSKSLTRSSSSSSSSSSPSSPLSALPPASVLIALAKLSLSEREADDARRASRAALKSAKARGLPAASEAFLSARVAAARAAALSSSSSSSVLDREELSSIRDAAPRGPSAPPARPPSSSWFRRTTTPKTTATSDPWRGA
jgi:hypothetical protein